MERADAIAHGSGDHVRARFNELREKNNALCSNKMFAIENCILFCCLNFFASGGICAHVELTNESTS